MRKLYCDCSIESVSPNSGRRKLENIDYIRMWIHTQTFLINIENTHTRIMITHIKVNVQTQIYGTYVKIVLLQLCSHTTFFTSSFWHNTVWPACWKGTKGNRLEALIYIVAKWCNGVWAQQCCVQLYCVVVLHISSAQKKLIPIKASMEVGVAHLWNWSWKRSRCPCKVSAGRPEVSKQIHHNQ